MSIQSLVVGFLFSRAAGSVWDALKRDPEKSQLQEEAMRWVAELPDGLGVNSQTFFPVFCGSSAPVGPDQNSLREALADRFGLPDIALFHAALMERWRHVRDDPAATVAFFSQPTDEASEHLRALAERLRLVCGTQTARFRAHQIQDTQADGAVAPLARIEMVSGVLSTRALGQENEKDGKFCAETQLRVRAQSQTARLAAVALDCFSGTGIQAWGQELSLASRRGERWVTLDAAQEEDRLMLADTLQVASDPLLLLKGRYQTRLPSQYPWLWAKGIMRLRVWLNDGTEDPLMHEAVFQDQDTREWLPCPPPSVARWSDEEVESVFRQGFLSEAEVAQLSFYSEECRYLALCETAHFEKRGEYGGLITLLRSLRKRLLDHPRPPFPRNLVATAREVHLEAGQKALTILDAEAAAESVRVSHGGLCVQHKSWLAGDGVIVELPDWEPRDERTPLTVSYLSANDEETAS